MWFWRKSPFSQSVPRAAAIVLFLVAGLFMLGWILEPPFLLGLQAKIRPMPFNTGLCFLFVAGLLWSRKPLKTPLVTGLLFLLSLIPSLVLLQAFSGMDLGIDELFVKSFVASAWPGRMSTLTACCFLLFALTRILLFQPTSALPAQLLLMISALSLLTISIFALFGHWTGERAAYDFGGSIPMSPWTAGLFLVSIFSLTPRIIRKITKSQSTDYLPYLTAISLVLVTLIGWQVAIVHENYLLESQAAIQSELYTGFIDGTLQEMASSLSRMSKRWAATQGTPEDLWRQDALEYYKDLEGIIGLGYADRESVITWIEPRETNDSAVGFRLNSESVRDRAIRKVIETKEAVATEAIELKQGGLGFLVLTPIVIGGRVDGFIYAAIRYEDFLKKRLSSRDYQVTVYENGRILYPEQADPGKMPAASADQTQFPGVAWTISVEPLQVLSGNVKSLVADMILISGLIFSGLVGYLVHLQIRHRKSARDFRLIAQWNEAIVKGSQLAIISTDAQGVIKSFNAAAEELLGYTADEVVGRETPALWHLPDEVVARAAQLSSELGKPVQPGFDVFRARPDLGEVYKAQWGFRQKSGSIRTVSLSVHALTDGDQTNGYVGIVEDITDKIASEKNVIDAMDRALTATHAKSQFLANMSHEIRTPLNGILGMAHLLLDSPLNDEQRSYADAIKTSGENLLAIINDILDISKIEAGKLEFEIIDFDVIKLLEVVKKSLDFSATKKGIELRSGVSEDMPRWLKGDPTRIRQILQNLVGNAIKFTPQGFVQITLSCQKMEDGKAHIRVEVVDTGIGIPRAAMGRLFRIFSQAETSTTRRYGGTGLGLSICFQLVHMMDGSIGVDSEEGKGSKFWFEIALPVAAVPRNEQPVLASVPTVSCRILLAEDNLINQVVARQNLEKLGHRVDIVTNGQEVLDALQKGSYDLILMDCNMPEMDGYEATRRIRESRADFSSIPIIAMTANAMSKDREHCLAVGMNDYISKPMRPGEINEVIGRVLDKLHHKARLA